MQTIRFDSAFTTGIRQDDRAPIPGACRTQVAQIAPEHIETAAPVNGPQHAVQIAGAHHR